MASITRINSVYHVRVRIKGHKIQCKSFAYKADALRWGKETERAIQLGTLITNDCTLNDLIDRYAKQISPTKRSAYNEPFRLRAFRRSWLADVYVSKLNSSHIARFRDERLQEVSPSTCLRDLNLLSHIINIAMREWNFNLPCNPVSQVRKPAENRSRDRRLGLDEENRLLSDLLCSKNIWAAHVVNIAIETAMRRGELLGLEWQHVDLDKRTAYLPITKNGTSRTIPLSLKAIDTLQNLPRDISGWVFPISAVALRSLWRRACKRAGIEDLRFHDLRHEATSRFFEKGLNVMEVAAITGHKDLRMLQRYTHLRAEDLAVKLG